jgi:hypothetical protein
MAVLQSITMHGVYIKRSNASEVGSTAASNIIDVFTQSQAVLLPYFIVTRQKKLQPFRLKNSLSCVLVYNSSPAIYFRSIDTNNKIVH